MAAAQVAAQRTVTRRSLDNGMVKFEVVLASDEAAIVWAALNAAIAKVERGTDACGTDSRGTDSCGTDSRPLHEARLPRNRLRVAL